MGIANAKAEFDKDGKLKVTSDEKVENLNAAMLDGVSKSGFLRTDENSAVATDKKLTINGTIEVPSSGVCKVGGVQLVGTANGLKFTFGDN